MITGIALKSIANTGKTETLKEVIAILEESYKYILIGKKSDIEKIKDEVACFRRGSDGKVILVVTLDCSQWFISGKATYFIDKFMSIPIPSDYYIKKLDYELSKNLLMIANINLVIGSCKQQGSSIYFYENICEELLIVGKIINTVDINNNLKNYKLNHIDAERIVSLVEMFL